MQRCRTLELFSGIGGIRLGFESVGGFEFTQAVEVSPSARRVYTKHFGDTPIWDDVQTFHADRGKFDCIIGGSPCQDFSGCGRKRGIEGERSRLWWEMLRIIDECRPAFIGWENVEGALSRGCREVIAGLRMVGYAVEGPIVVSAQELGAPHQRKRIFLVGYANHLSQIIKGTSRSWEEQIGEFLEVGRQYSYSQSQRCSAGLQHGGERRHQFDGLLEAGNTRIQGLQGNLSHQEARSQCRVTRQPVPVHQRERIGESAGVGMNDGISEELVRVGADAPWLLGIDRSGWWRRQPPPLKAGLQSKRIKGRRDCINHYGAACVPAQAIPLALRIKYLWELVQNVGIED
ncbi:DNA cytosine methyltransferase [Microcoleus sp. herbarium14]|uniref:DNA cytosine methyltransferase n=1 Tax=Microcoleus sp. herbarium14 TaxID=3055439 RepID=UPI002FD1984C